MNKIVKHLFVKTLSSAPLSAIGDKFCAKHIPVFMLHRFACPELGILGHDEAMLRYALEFMRKRKFNFISIEDVALAVKNQTPLPRRSIAFTIDDGYWDHVEGPAQIFAEYDCPTTYFVATGFISKELWLWDSKVAYLIDEINMSQVGKIQEMFPALALAEATRPEIVESVVFELANHVSSVINEKIKSLSNILEIELPDAAPEKYQSTTWSRLRDIERMGMRIAPHSYSHPILANETDENSYFELEKSRDDVSKHVKSPANIFCYPVGRSVDFGDRECRYAEQLGFNGAVSAAPPAVNLDHTDKLFRLPRFAFPDSKADVIQYSTWIESIKSSFRG